MELTKESIEYFNSAASIDHIKGSYPHPPRYVSSYVYCTGATLDHLLLMFPTSYMYFRGSGVSNRGCCSHSNTKKPMSDLKADINYQQLRYLG